MESSDESFVWTNASSDSDMALDVQKENGKDESDSDFKHKRELSQSKKKAKKRKHNEETDISVEQEKHKNIKSEIESDIDPPKKKRKKRSESLLNSSDTKETFDEIDNYLNIRVKQEQESFVDPSDAKPKKKKKHKQEIDSSDIQNSGSLKPHSLIDDQTIKISSDSQGTLNEIDDYLNYRVKLEQASFVEPTETKTKKKKLKKNLDANISDSYDSQSAIEDSTTNQVLDSTEESCEIKKKKTKNKNKSKDKDCSAELEGIENHENNTSKRKKSVSKKDNDTYDEREIVENAYINYDETNVNASPKNIICEPEKENISDEKQKSISIYSRSSNTDDAIIPDNEQSKTNKSFSEKLRFEDDDSRDFESVNDEQDEKLPKHIKQFIKINNHITPTSSKIHSDHFVSEDDEVLIIIKCPNEFDTKDFKDITLTLDNKCKMKLNGQTYDGAFDDSIQRVPILALDKNRKKTVIKNVPIMGVTKFRKRLPKARIPDQGTLINNLTNFIPLPETKCRHPLFGIHYKKAIKIPPSIAERLNGLVEESSLADSVKKKKKKHKKETCTTESECEVESEQIEDIQLDTSSKKKRKRKHSDELDGPPCKSKKIKYDPDSAQAWESEQAIKNNLFGFE